MYTKKVILDPSLNLTVGDIYSKIYDHLGYNFDIITNSIQSRIYMTMRDYIPSCKYAILLPHFDYKKELDQYRDSMPLDICEHHDIRKKYTYDCKTCKLVYCILCEDVLDMNITTYIPLQCPRCTHETCTGIRYDKLLDYIEDDEYYYCRDCKRFYHLLNYYDYQSHIHCEYITNNIFIKARYILDELNDPKRLR